jgi:hypothetical protein
MSLFNEWIKYSKNKLSGLADDQEVRVFIDYVRMVPANDYDGLWVLAPAQLVLQLKWKFVRPFILDQNKSLELGAEVPEMQTISVEVVR